MRQGSVMLKSKEAIEEMNGYPKPHTTLKTNLQCSLIIALCFLWTATGYLFFREKCYLSLICLQTVLKFFKFSLDSAA